MRRQPPLTTEEPMGGISDGMKGPVFASPSVDAWNWMLQNMDLEALLFFYCCL